MTFDVVQDVRRGEWLIRRKEILEENKTKDPRLFLQWRFETPYVVRKCPVLRKKKKNKKNPTACDFYWDFKPNESRLSGRPIIDNIFWPTLFTKKKLYVYIKKP